jgi:hypothetical protein
MLMFGLVVVLCLTPLFALAAAAQRSMPRGDRPDRRGVRVARILAGVVGYPAASTGIYLLIGGSGSYALTVVAVVAPGLLFGALVRRLWIAVVPLVGAAVAYTIGYVSDPSCAGCGEREWFSIVVGGLIFVVAPAIFTLLLGILVRNLLTTLRAQPFRRWSA